MKRLSWLAAAAAAALAVTALGVASKVTHRGRPPDVPARDAASALEMRVPRAAGPITIDGEFEDPGWRGDVARTRLLRSDTGELGRPYSDVRLVWDGELLYLTLYAADEDIRATHTQPDDPVWLEDSFHVLFVRDGVEHTLDVSPLGTLADAERRGDAAGDGGAHPFEYRWQSGARVAHDLDGTPNDASDDDEEWVIELAVPLAALGVPPKPGERIGFAVRRCDVPKHAARTCAGWGDAAAPGTLVLDDRVAR